MMKLGGRGAFVAAAVALILVIQVLTLQGALATTNRWVRFSTAKDFDYSYEDMTYDPANKCVYCAWETSWAAKSIYKWDGSKWTDIWPGYPGGSVYDICLDPVHNGLYVAGPDVWGIYYYSISARTWTEINAYDAHADRKVPGPNALAYDAQHDVLYAGGSIASAGDERYRGVWKNASPRVGGQGAWVKTGGGAPSTLTGGYDIQQLKYDYVRNLLYAVCWYWPDSSDTMGRGVWKYNGSSWVKAGDPVSKKQLYCEALNRNNGDLYVGSRTNGVFKYNGSSWTHLGCGGSDTNSKYIFTIVYDSTRGVVYTGDYEAQVFGYASGKWTKVYPNEDIADAPWIRHLALDETRDVLYADTGAAAWYTNLGGPGPNPNPHPDKGAKTFYFAEGCCRPTFNCYFCIQNPNSDDASVTITYMKGDGTTDSQSLTVPKSSRATVDAFSKLGMADDSAHDFSARVECTKGTGIVAERPMYFSYGGLNGWNGGHDVVGATSTSTTYYFAEGTCRPGFEPYFCIQNPGAQTAAVKITYMKGDGTTASQALSVKKNSRSTVRVKDTLGEGNDAAHDFSAKVECTNNQGIIAERPMYFDYMGGANLNWTGGSDVIGATSPASTFYFAEGTCRPGFDPFLSIQNPGNKDATVKITYMKGDGTTATDQLTIKKNSRSTVLPRAKLPTTDTPASDFSTKVECTNGQGIIAERPMYFNYAGYLNGGHDVMGANAPASTFCFAEGTCRPDYFPYLCIQNPGGTDAKVTITYMKGDGSNVPQTLTVPKNSRSTVTVKDTLGSADDNAHDFSARVECTNGQKIIVERPMYFNQDTWTGGSDVIGFH